MPIGASHEYLAMQILDLVKTEINKNSLATSQTIINNYGISVNSTPGEIKKSIKVDQIYSRLNSDNFTLKLMYEDTLNPKYLTSVVMVFEENVKLLINLIRIGKKLSSVSSSILLLTSAQNSINNPMGMVTTDFILYLMNKKAWSYFNQQVQDLANHPEHYPTLTVQEITDKITALNVKKAQMELGNSDLRSIYGILGDNTSYNDLIHYAPNPVGMVDEDYIAYVLNKEIYRVKTPQLRLDMTNTEATVRGELDLSLALISLSHWSRVLLNAGNGGIFVIKNSGTMDFGGGSTVSYNAGDIIILNKTVVGIPTAADIDLVTFSDYITTIKKINDSIQANVVLRTKYSLFVYDVNDTNSNLVYFEFEDIFPYYDRTEPDGTITKGLRSYLPNPLGMQLYDYKLYIGYKQQMEGLDPSDPALTMYGELMSKLMDKYCVLEDHYTWQELEAFIKDTTVEELLLFKILISLNYVSGKLDGVTSEVTLS